jgi:hypothetical protein
VNSTITKIHLIGTSKCHQRRSNPRFPGLTTAQEGLQFFLELLSWPEKLFLQTGFMSSHLIVIKKVDNPKPKYFPGLNTI